MRESVKNAMRSGVVVIGALAFGYLTLQLAFKPYLEKSQHEFLQSVQHPTPTSQPSSSSSSSAEKFDDAHILISDEGFEDS